jgi:hypothetical protein
MKRLGFLLGLTLVVSQASAQGLPPGYSGPMVPMFVGGEFSAPGEYSAPAPPAAYEDASAEEDSGRLVGNRKFSNFIGFLGNPLQNIDPRAVTEIYPIFGTSSFNTAGPLPGGNFQLYGAGLTVALSERLAVGLNQGGYTTVHIDSASPAFVARTGRDFGGNRDGFLNLGGFAQYTFVEDEDRQFLVTGGVRWEAPCGSTEVFQGHGPVHLAPYLTAGKELGKYHVLGTFGYQFPVGGGGVSTDLFYANLHLDRQICGWFYPVVEFNTTYHSSKGSANGVINSDFISAGDFSASGNLLTLGVGANAVLVRDRLEFGAIYSTPIASQRNFDFNSLLVKMVIRY